MRWWTEVEGGLCFCDNFEASTLLSFLSLDIDSRIGRALSCLHLRCLLIGESG